MEQATVGNVYCTCMNKCMSCPRIEQYVASLYWSLVTMTTLGYGDITPTNNSERAFCIYAMLVGACIFAYSVTNMCTLVHNLNPSLVYFRNRVDQLNDLMEFMRLPGGGLSRRFVVKHVFPWVSQSGQHAVFSGAYS